MYKLRLLGVNAEDENSKAIADVHYTLRGQQQQNLAILKPPRVLEMSWLQESLNYVWRNQPMQGWSLETSSLYESSKATVLEASVTNMTWICKGGLKVFLSTVYLKYFSN